MDPAEPILNACLLAANSFGLKHRPQVVVRPEDPVPLVKISFTGFVTLSAQPRIMRSGCRCAVAFSLAEGEKR